MSNETILSEVDEELRRDRFRALWRLLAPWVIIAAVAIVLAVAINEGWQWWQNSNAARSSDQFYAALEKAESGDIAGARMALNLVKASGAGNYPVLARFRDAALLGRDGKTVDAVAAYDALTRESSLPNRVRELALVLAANLLVDSGDVSQVQQRVGGLITPDNPLRNAAREALGLTQYKAGDTTAALETFESVAADQGVDQNLSSRIQVYISQLVAEGATTSAQQAAAAANQTVVTDTPVEPTPAVETAPATPATEPAAPTPAPTEVPATPTPTEAPVTTPTETPPAAPQETPATPPAETPTPTPTEVPATPATPEAPAN